VNVEKFLKEHDLQFFLEKKSLRDVVKLAKEAGVEGTVSTGTIKSNTPLMKQWRRSYCILWGRRINPRSATKVKETEYWEKLKAVVEKNLVQLQGQKIDVAERIVRIHIATNTDLLRGLPQRLQVWV
jgi:hypothetical protein